MTEHKITPRVKWGSQVGFLFAAIGSAIGLGNIWRFSYMVYENGGGAFLVPYFVALFTAGIPLLILEYGLGHKKHGASSLAFAKISKKWEWLGWWMPLFAFFGIMLYYTVVISWCANYTLLSFNLGWGGDTQSFFIKEFLQLSSGVFNIGGVVPHIFWGLIFVWGVCWFICYREVNHGIEKACLIFMPILFILTTILVAWGLTLNGAWEGLKWYLSPDWGKIMNWQVWMAAYGQIFFTLTLAFGVMIAYASYLPKRTEITKNAYITSFTNCFYSFFAGFAVFSVLGYMALKVGQPISQVVKSGPTLAFVVYPEAISKLPAFNSLFGVIFFATLVIAGLSSAISLIEAFAAGITDKFNFKRKRAVTGLCVVGFLGSLIFATRAGLFWLDIVDHFLNQYGLVTAGLLECLVIGWILKARVLRTHINVAEDTGKLGHFWDWTIKIFTPGILVIMLLTSFWNEFQKPYGGYEVNALLLLGVCWLAITVIAAIILSRAPWDKKKLEHNHFPEEDHLLV